MECPSCYAACLSSFVAISFIPKAYSSVWTWKIQTLSRHPPVPPSESRVRKDDSTGCSGLSPVRHWKPPRMEMAQPPWSAWFAAALSSWGKLFSIYPVWTALLVVCVSIKEDVLVPHWKVQWIRFYFFHSTDSREESVLGSIPLPSYVISPVGPEDRINRKFSFKVQLPSLFANHIFKYLFALQKML